MKSVEELGISPLPWTLGSLVLGSDGLVARSSIDDADDGVVAGDALLRDADARLMTASPKLYERLSEAVRDKCHCCDASEDDKRELCDQCIVADWKEALAEASGEVSNG